MPKNVRRSRTYCLQIDFEYTKFDGQTRENEAVAIQKANESDSSHGEYSSVWCVDPYWNRKQFACVKFRVLDFGSLLKINTWRDIYNGWERCGVVAPKLIAIYNSCTYDMVLIRNE